MPQVVDFEKVSTEGLESSPFADALAGLRVVGQFELGRFRPGHPVFVETQPLQLVYESRYQQF